MLIFPDVSGFGFLLDAISVNMDSELTANAGEPRDDRDDLHTQYDCVLRRALMMTEEGRKVPSAV